jgi:chemotaxis protein CheC
MTQKLEELHMDMLAEIFNMGMGQAVFAISHLSGKDHEVVFEIPSVEVVDKKEFINSTNITSGIGGMIVQSYHGQLEGCAVMFYPELGGKQLAKLLIGTDIPPEKIEQLESDALIEVGNIFINAAITCLSRFLSSEIKTDLPKVVYSDKLGLTLGEDTSELLLLNSSFTIEHMRIEGKLAFALDNISLQKLLKEIDRYLEVL